MATYRGTLATREAAFEAVNRIEKLLTVASHDEFLTHILTEANGVVKQAGFHRVQKESLEAFDLQ